MIARKSARLVFDLVGQNRVSYGVAISLPLDCCDYLDWSEISIEKTYHNHTRHLSVKRIMVVKSSFS